MDERIPLLIDTDPGVDDALALLMAFADPRHEVVGLTIAAGNVGLEHTVANALRLCEVVGRQDVPVFAGCDRPLLHPSPDAANVHGADGFGDAGLAPARREAEARHAAEASIALSHEHAGRLLLVALGPLTNLALALRLDPGLPTRIARLVVMGGAVTGHGNITPSRVHVFSIPRRARRVRVVPALDSATGSDASPTLLLGDAERCGCSRPWGVLRVGPGTPRCRRRARRALALGGRLGDGDGLRRTALLAAADVRGVVLGLPRRARDPVPGSAAGRPTGPDLLGRTWPV